MSKSLLLVTFALVAGIVAAHEWFYEASVAVSPWLGVSLWGFCCVLMLVLLWLYRRSLAASIFASHHAFVWLTFVFFFVVGFARYASTAETVQAAWAQMERPPVNRGNPDEFDYRRWRWVQGAEADSASLLGKVKAKALSLRSRLVRQYAASGLDDEALALVAAVTLGDRSMLRRETRDLYAAAGASHLLALSGLHLGIIVGLFLTWLNGRWLLSRWRPLLALLILLFIWTFAFVAGLPTSLVRASLMTSVFVLASLIGRGGQPLNHLVLTAWLMLLCRPFFLFDVGTQLSFAAVAGILVIHPRVSKWAFERWRFRLFWLQRYHLLWPFQLFSVSFSAQLFTLPLVAFYFHRISLYAPLFSLLFIPLTTLLIYGALFVLLLGFILPALAAWLSGGLAWLVALQLSLMRFEVGLPGAVIHDFWSQKAEPQVVVYHNRRCPALHLIASPSQSWLLMPQPDSLETGMKYIASTFWERRLTAPPKVLRQRSAVVLRGFSAVMVDGDDQPATTSPPMEVDILWLTRGFRGGHLQSLPLRYAPRLLVLDASLPRWQRETLAVEAGRVGWRVYDVARQGALRLTIE